MPEVIFNGPEGRLEGRYQPGKEPNAPIAIVLHPHPEFGGTMNNQIVYHLFYMFAQRGFSVLRFNSRGVGRSQGMFDHGVGEALGRRLGARLAAVAQPRKPRLLDRRLLVRRLDRHAAADAPPGGRRLHLGGAAGKPLRFLVPRPLPVLRPHHPRRQGPRRAAASVQKLVDKLKTQKGITIEQQIVDGANHFFEGKVDELIERCSEYLDRRRAEIAAGKGR